nr:MULTISPECIES: ribonuclease J [Mesobacillus]
MIKNENVKIIALGGVGEMGKNMYVTEVDNDIFVMDAGLMFPEDDMLGIDIVIPDFSYLSANSKRVKGVFLTHGHEDHIGALTYLLRKLTVPVYGTKLTLALAKEKIKEQEFTGKVDFQEITADTELDFGNVSISFFKTNHSIPDSVGICIHTSEGAIVYTGDFKFDQAAARLYKPEIGRMASIGERGVLCLLSDSTEAEKPGYTPSESLVVEELSRVFYNANGRIIAACFASDLNRIQHLIDTAISHGRKVAVVGENLKRVIEIALELGYLQVESDCLLSVEDIKRLADTEVVFLIADSQGEPIEVLQKMAKKAHPQVNIQEGDTVLFAASPLRGREVFLYKTMDMLYRAGANVVASKNSVQVSSHGSQEELKFMINLMNPKFFIPVHGEYKMLKAHKKVAQSCGVPEENIFIPNLGDVIDLSGGILKSTQKVQAGNTLIDGIGVGDVGNIVLRDRRLLSQDGVLIVVVTLNKADRKIISGPEILSRGFVYVRESEKLMVDSAAYIKEIVEKNLLKEQFDWTGLKQEMRDFLHQYLFEKTKRRPMILPILMEVKR